MTDEKNDSTAQDRSAQTPPPLVPPPVRSDETSRDDVQRDVAAEPVFVEPTRHDESASSSDDDLDRDDVATASAGSVPYQPVSAVRANDRPVSAVRAEDRLSDDQLSDDRRDEAPLIVDRKTPDRAPDRADQERDLQRPSARAVAADAETVTVANPSTSPAATPEPVFVPAAEGGTERTAQYSPPLVQREFVQAPVPPKKKGNRGIGSIIALVSVIGFAVLYALIAAGIIAIQQPQRVNEVFPDFLINPRFWVPAIIFVVAFVLVVLLANRASWWAYVLGSLLVGALVYFGTIGAAVLSANVFTLTPAEATQLIGRAATDPFIIAAGLVAREVSLWTGAAISARGRRVKARNVSARDDYERAAAEHRSEYERSSAAR